MTTTFRAWSTVMRPHNNKYNDIVRWFYFNSWLIIRKPSRYILHKIMDLIESRFRADETAKMRAALS